MIKNRPKKFHLMSATLTPSIEKLVFWGKVNFAGERQ